MPTVDCHGAHIAMVNMDTGEVMEELHGEVHATDEPYNKPERFNDGEPFVKMYSKIAYVLGEKLSGSQYKMAYRLAYFIEYQTSILTIVKNHKKCYMTLEDIANVMHMEYKATARIIHALVKRGVMTVVPIGHCDNEKKEKYYVMNPYIYINGRVPSQDTLNIFFGNTGWKELMKEIENFEI